MAKLDRNWLRRALGVWPKVQSHDLGARPRPLPMLIFFDARCSYRMTPSGSQTKWAASEHRGKLTVPNGPTFSADPQASFNSISQNRAFLIMGLPSVWRPIAPTSEIPLGWFLEGVLLHELAHSFQAQATPSVWFLALQEQGYSPDKLSDDAVQDKFARVPEYAADYAAERDMFYRAATAPGEAEARSLTCIALAKMRSRRARYFNGLDDNLTRVDEVSLTTEGLGQWVAFNFLTKRRKLPASLVLSKLRGPFWSQDEGLAIFLVLDRLVPNWQKSLLASSPVTVEGQIARACTTSR